MDDLENFPGIVKFLHDQVAVMVNAIMFHYPPAKNNTYVTGLVENSVKLVALRLVNEYRDEESFSKAFEAERFALIASLRNHITQLTHAK